MYTVISFKTLDEILIYNAINLASKIFNHKKNFSVHFVLTAFSVVTNYKTTNALGLCSFGMIWIWIIDPRSLGLWCIKGTNESALGKDSPVLLMCHDPSDLR